MPIEDSTQNTAHGLQSRRRHRRHGAARADATTSLAVSGGADLARECGCHGHRRATVNLEGATVEGRQPHGLAHRCGNGRR